MRVIVIAAALLICLAATRSFADPVSYGFAGTVDYVSADIQGTNTPYGFDVGQTMTGFFTYDVDVVWHVAYSDWNPLDGFSDNWGAFTEFSMTVGSYTADTPPTSPWEYNLAQVADLTSTPDIHDIFIASAELSGPSLGTDYLYGYLNVQKPMPDRELAHVGDLSLPPGSGQWYLSFGHGGGEPLLSGTLTSVEPIPEPSTFGLLGLGTLGLLLVRRKYKAS